MLGALEVKAESARPGSPDRKSEGPPRGQSAGAGLRVGRVPGRGPACACSGGGRARGPAPSGLRAPGAAPLSPLPGSGSVVLPSGRWEALCPPAALALAPPRGARLPLATAERVRGRPGPLQAADGSRVPGLAMPVDHRDRSAAAVEREFLAGPRTDRARGSRRLRLPGPGAASCPPAPAPSRPDGAARGLRRGGGTPDTGRGRARGTQAQATTAFPDASARGAGLIPREGEAEAQRGPWRGRGHTARPGLHPPAPMCARPPGSGPSFRVLKEMLSLDPGRG